MAINVNFAKNWSNIFIWRIIKHSSLFLSSNLLKKTLKKNFSKLTKYDILWPKMTLSGIIYTKTTKSLGKPVGGPRFVISLVGT